MSNIFTNGNTSASSFFPFCGKLTAGFYDKLMKNISHHEHVLSKIRAEANETLAHLQQNLLLCLVRKEIEIRRRHGAVILQNDPE